MREMRCEAGCEKPISRMEARSIQEPGEKQRPVGVGSEGNGVEDDGSGNTTLLKKSSELLAVNYHTTYISAPVG